MFEIGNSLREARTRKGLDFPELEQGTKIRAKYLRALEDESFDQLPSATYVKGFLRTYANYLGLDGQLYVDEYNVRYGSGDEVLERRDRGAIPAAAHAPAPAAADRVELVWFALLGIAVVTALVIAAWRYGGSGSSAAAARARRRRRRRAASSGLIVSAHRREHAPDRPRRLRDVASRSGTGRCRPGSRQRFGTAPAASGSTSARPRTCACA